MNDRGAYDSEKTSFRVDVKVTGKMTPCRMKKRYKKQF
jgi:hypothetical protein